MTNVVSALQLMPLGFYMVLSVLFGLILGSFANVLIWRTPRNESIMKPGSHCPDCLKPIRWYDNIPLFSYILLLRGKCRDCKKPISLRYPIVELTVALVALWGVVAWQGDPVRQLMAVLLSPILMSLALIDIELMELPDSLVTAIAVIGLFGVFLTGGSDATWQVVTLLVMVIFLTIVWRKIFGKELTEEEQKMAEDSEPTLKERLIWGGGGFLIGVISLVIGFYGTLNYAGWNAVWGLLAGGGGLLTLWGFFLFLQGREAIGLGDIKLMAAVGIITGPGRVLIAYVLGAILGILIWIAMRIKKGHGTDQPFPFGPALISGAWVSWLYGEALLDWYLKLIFS